MKEKNATVHEPPTLLSSIMHTTLRTLRPFILKSQPISSIRNLSSRAIVFPSTGNPHEILSLHSYSLPDVPSRDSVLVKFLAAPINPADLNQIEGVYPSKAKFQSLPGKEGDWAVGGNEGVVKILRVGENIKHPGMESGRWAIMKSTAFGLCCFGLVDERNFGGLMLRRLLMRYFCFLRMQKSVRCQQRQFL